ncbi:MAG TPA: hypothetical protein VGJ18_03450 [Gemmatimonadaceae bacterium]
MARSDWVTVGAFAVLVHVIAVLTHEALGHGGACLLMGCTPRLVTTMDFLGDESALSHWAVRVVAAGGTIANLLVASLTLLLLGRRKQAATGRAWFFLWLLATVNLLQASGYLLYSGIMNIGDWSDVVRGFAPAWFWRVALSVIGAYTYWMAVKWSMRQLGKRLGVSSDARVADAYRYTLVAYFAAGCLELMAGFREPGGAVIVLMSGVAASFGGTSGLVWGPQLLRDRRFAAPRGEPLLLTRNWLTILAAAIAGALFIIVLGPGVRLHS